MEEIDLDNLASRIAAAIKPGSDPALRELRDSLEKLSLRIDMLEVSILGDRSSSNIKDHPSVEKFALPEAAGDLIAGGKEKACTFEPNGKPCDHCSMCNSRGF